MSVFCALLLDFYHVLKKIKYGDPQNLSRWERRHGEPWRSGSAAQYVSASLLQRTPLSRCATAPPEAELILCDDPDFPFPVNTQKPRPPKRARLLLFGSAFAEQDRRQLVVLQLGDAFRDHARRDQSDQLNLGLNISFFSCRHTSARQMASKYALAAAQYCSSALASVFSVSVAPTVVSAAA